MDDANVVLTEEPRHNSPREGEKPEIRIADEVLTRERTERQGDGGDGHCAEPHQGGECRRGARKCDNVRTNGPGACSAARDSAARPQDEGKIVAELLDLEYVLRYRQGNTNRRSLERATCSKQPHRAHCCQFCALLRDKMEASQRTSYSRWKDARIGWQDVSLQ